MSSFRSVRVQRVDEFQSHVEKKNKLSQGQTRLIFFSTKHRYLQITSVGFLFLSVLLIRPLRKKEEKNRKGNLTRLKIADIYDDVPNRRIKFTAQIIK